MPSPFRTIDAVSVASLALALLLGSAQGAMTTVTADYQATTTGDDYQYNCSATGTTDTVANVTTVYNFVCDYDNATKTCTVRGPEKPAWQEAVEWIVIFLLICMSGLFSGLTLGLMGLDKMGLEIVIESDDLKNARFAEKIKPVRENGNLLLCTLLLGNVAVNAALSTLTADKFGGIAGFLGSTAAITIFGEIVPQAACSRFALYVGAKSVLIVKFFIVLLYPITKPISWILDKVLGDEIGTIHSKTELMALLKQHVKHHALDDEEGDIMTGAIKYREKLVTSVMTPIDKAFMIHVDAILNFRTISDLWKSGYSRVPVYGADRNDIVGLLLVKDLIMIDPEDNTSVRQLVPFFGRAMHHVFDDQKLHEVLKIFKQGKGHLGMVQRVNGDGPGDPFYEMVGIVTLEDIIEEILGDEIVDETDVFVHVEAQDRVERQSFDFARLKLLDTTQTDRRLDAQEGSAVVAHLVANVPEFSTAKRTDKPGRDVSAQDVRWLVMRSEVLNWEDELENDVKLGLRSSDERVAKTPSLQPGVVAAPAPRRPHASSGGSNSGGGGGAGNRRRATSFNKSLYRRGKQDEFCTLVLSGKLMIIAGRDNFKSEAGPFTIIGSGCLNSLNKP